MVNQHQNDVRTGDLRQAGLTWNRFVLLKNRKLILDRDDRCDSVIELLDSREAGRVTWAKGFSRSDLKSIWGGAEREETINTNNLTQRYQNLLETFSWFRLSVNETLQQTKL